MIEKIKHLPKSFKISLFILVLISGAYVSSWALGYGQNNNSDGLVLDITLSSDYYTAGTKTFSDQSGNNNNGVSANNAVFVPDRDGKSEGAMSFNGSSDYVSAGNSSIYDLQSAGTVSAWVKIPSTWSGNVYPNLVSKGASAGWDTNGWSLYAFSDGRIGIGMRNGSTTSIRDFTNTIKDQWTHIVGIWDGTTIRIYQDGVFKASGSQGVNPGLNTNNVIIARGPTSYYFGGQVAQVKIYNRAFSAEEVKKLYGDSKPKIQASSLEKGLVGYWPLDGAHYNSNTNRVTDKSAYSNHGTNSGATLTADRFGRSAGAMGFGNTAGLERIITPIQNINYNLTMCAWIRPTSYPSERSTIFLGSGGYYLSLYSDGALHTYWYGRDPSGYHSSTPGTMPLNEWSHGCAIWTNNSASLYINGIQRNVVAVNNAPGNNASLLILGAESTGRQFKGDITEARIYNRALSDIEIKSLYERDAPKVSASSLRKGLVLDMPLTSDYIKGGDVITDLSAYSNNGQKYLGNISQSGYDVTGVNGYIDHPVISFNKTESWTFSMWQYKPSGSGTLWQGFIGSSMGAAGGYWMFHPSLSWYQDYYDDGSGYKAYSYMYSPVNLGDEIPYDQWYMLTVAYDDSNSNVHIYVNGELENSGLVNWSPRPVSQFSFKTIGRGDGSRYFDGKLSNVKIYNRTLSATEVKSLYDQGRSQTGVILGGN